MCQNWKNHRCFKLKKAYRVHVFGKFLIIIHVFYEILETKGKRAHSKFVELLSALSVL